MNLRRAILYFRCKGMECLGILYGMCVPVGRGRGVGKLIGEKLALEKGTR
jgi:hypothetical protein